LLVERRLNDEAAFTQFKADTLMHEPNGIYPIRLKLELQRLNCRSDNEVPSVSISITETRELTVIWRLQEKLDPTDIKDNADIAEFILLNDLIDTLDDAQPHS
jgi:hypothetical protein